MNNIIEIVEFKNRISLKEDYDTIICGNTNYYLKFTFDEEWSTVKDKQLVLEVLGKKTFLNIGEDNTCKLPPMPNAISCFIMVKCIVSENEYFASNTLKIRLEPNQMSEEVELMDPFKGYYSTLLSKLEKVENGDIVAKTSDYATVSGKSESQVSLTGNEEILGVKNFKEEIKKNDKIVPNIDEISNENLLINPEMIINQRGNNYSIGKDIYFVDRWQLNDELANAYKMDSGKWRLSIEKATSMSTRYLFCQHIEQFESLRGKTVTFSISVSDLSEDIKNSTVMYIYDGSSETLKLENGVFSLTKTIREDATQLRVGVRTTVVGKNTQFIVNWCKLEEGSYATKFSSKLYSQDFRDCQRYYQKVRLNGGASTASSTSALYCAIPLPVTMRTVPTMVSHTVPSIRGKGSIFNATSISINSLYDNLVVFNVYGGGNLVQYEVYALHNGDVSLDAEIYQ